MQSLHDEVLLKRREKGKPLQYSSQMVIFFFFFWCWIIAQLFLSIPWQAFRHTQPDIHFPIIELLVQEFVIFQPGSWLLLLIEVVPDCSYFSPAEKSSKKKNHHPYVSINSYSARDTSLR